ncbi:MAG: tetratricopeptide (TPR) repeat protein [Rhodothermales bacterium]|jgi:tetratricopeptide (TPR) repeat protein
MSRKRKKSTPVTAPSPHRWAVLIIVAVCLLAHGIGVRNGFVNFDDDLLVQNNLAIRSLSPGHVASLFVPTVGETYQPVRVLSYAIDYKLWKLRPAGYHAVNILLHTGAAVLLYFFIYALLPFVGDLRNPVFAAALVALFFACHPVNVESVAWASSRKYGLLAVFGFASLWLYVRERAFSAIPFFALAVMSSPFGIVLPGLFVLTSLVTGRWAKREAYIVLAVVTFALLACLKLALGGEQGPGLGAAHIADQPHLTFFTMLKVITDYAMNLALPLNLHPRYPNHLLPSPMHPKAVLAILGLVASTWYTVYRFRSGDKRPLLCFGWIAIAWAPVSGIVPTSTMMADRYLYLPAIGAFLAVALLLDHFHWRKPAVVGAVVYLAVLSLLSIQQTSRWRDSLTLWSDSVGREPHNELALVSLGSALREAGRPDEAAERYRQAIAISNQFAQAHVHLGTYYGRRGEFDDAIRHLRRAVDLEPQNPDALGNLGLCLDAIKEYEEAEDWLRRAIEINPMRAEYHRNLGVVALHRNDVPLAVTSFNLALDLAPDSTLAEQVSSSLAGRDETAAEHFKQRQAALKRAGK